MATSLLLSRVFRTLWMTLFSLVLSSVTVVLGVIPLRTLVLSLGSKRFCFLVVVVSFSLIPFGFWSLATVFSSLAGLSVVGYELQSRGRGLFSSGFWAVISAFSVGGFVQAVSHNFSWQSFFETMGKQVQDFVSQIKTINPKLEVESIEILQQVPSVLIILLIFAFALSLILQDRFSFFLGDFLSEKQEDSQKVLNQFKVPDILVWVLLISFLLSFKNFDIKWLEILALNVLNVLAAIFFWQGLAIVASLFAIRKTGPFWRFLAYFFLVTQFFLGLALLGFVDFWLDFRDKLRPREGI